jgi:hypothetical protein
MQNKLILTKKVDNLSLSAPGTCSRMSPNLSILQIKAKQRMCDVNWKKPAGAKAKKRKIDKSDFQQKNSSSLKNPIKILPRGLLKLIAQTIFKKNLRASINTNLTDSLCFKAWMIALMKKQ